MFCQNSSVGLGPAPGHSSTARRSEASCRRANAGTEGSMQLPTAELSPASSLSCGQPRICPVNALYFNPRICPVKALYCQPSICPLKAFYFKPRICPFKALYCQAKICPLCALLRPVSPPRNTQHASRPDMTLQGDRGKYMLAVPKPDTGTRHGVLRHPMEAPVQVRCSGASFFCFLLAHLEARDASSYLHILLLQSGGSRCLASLISR